MFESLTDKLQNVFKKLRSKGRLTEQDVNEALREVRLVLLEADVNFKVVKDFLARVKERAIGVDVLESLSPAQQVIKVVNEELTGLLGGSESTITWSSKPPTVILMAGLQGGGKTTTCAKLASMIRKQGHRPLMVACDIYRPAAIKQLEILGEQLTVPVYSMGDKANPVDIARGAVQHAVAEGLDTVIVDTAGRLHVDEDLMRELKEIREAVNPDEILLVVDAMTGQDAVNVAKQFNDLLDVTGFVVTKLDGDSRGGAAISIKTVTGKPIKYVATGEKLDALEVFHPDRMASRILGMGDVLSLIERAQSTFDEKQALKLEEKLMANTFDLEDYLQQLNQMKKMGPLDQLLDMIPGMGGEKLRGVKVDEGQIQHVEAMILSMTPEERHNPQLIKGGRRKRIALGSGTSIQDVNQLLNQFEQMRKTIRQISEMGNTSRLGGALKLGKAGKIKKGGKRGKPFGFSFMR